MSRTLRDALNAVHVKTKFNVMSLSKQNNGINQKREAKCTAHSLFCRVRTPAHPKDTPQRHEGTLPSLTQRRTDREWVKSPPVF